MLLYCECLQLHILFPTKNLAAAWVKMWEIRRSFDDLTERLQESRVHNGEEEETKSLASGMLLLPLFLASL